MKRAILTLTIFMLFGGNVVVVDVDYSSFINQQFSSTSPFNMKIIDNPKIDPNSENIINLLATNQAGEYGFVIGVEGWTYPYFLQNLEHQDMMCHLLPNTVKMIRYLMFRFQIMQCLIPKMMDTW